MPTVGDRIRVSSTKIGQLPRDGVVTGVSGSLLRVKWSRGEESTVVPGAGSLAVVGKAKKTSGKASKKKSVATKKVSKKVTKKSVGVTKKRPAAAKKVSRSAKSPSKTKKTAKRRA